MSERTADFADYTSLAKASSPEEVQKAVAGIALCIAIDIADDLAGAEDYSDDATRLWYEAIEGTKNSIHHGVIVGFVAAKTLLAEAAMENSGG